MRWSITVCVALGCSGTPTRPVTVVPVADVKPAATTYGVTPAELGDPAAIRRIDHRVWVGRVGRTWTQLDDARSLIDARAHRELDTPRRVGVVAETRERIQIVAYADSAWLALWIDRADAMPVVVTTARLAPATGTRDDETTGVWLEPGALVFAGRRTTHRVEVIASNPYYPYPLRASGWVDVAAIGTVWIEPPVPPRRRIDGPEIEHRLTAGRVFAAPRDDAALIADVLEQREVTIASSLGAWDEIELHVREVRVRGFVPADRVTTTNVIRDHSNATADLALESSYEVNGPGITQLAFEAGTCLYDIAGGDPIGVQIIAGTRAGRLSDRGDGWWVVTVATEWGRVDAAVHELSSTGNARRWAHCSPARTSGGPQRR